MALSDFLQKIGGIIKSKTQTAGSGTFQTAVAGALTGGLSTGLSAVIGGIMGKITGKTQTAQTVVQDTAAPAQVSSRPVEIGSPWYMKPIVWVLAGTMLFGTIAYAVFGKKKRGRK